MSEINTLPTLKTERLLLRQFEMNDRQAVRVILSDSKVNTMLLNIPDPFLLADADLWIRGGHAGIAKGDLFPFAIVRQEDDRVLGCIDLELNTENHRADMAYWIGSAYWRHGYTSEAAREVMRFGFETLSLNRIYAQCLIQNVASSGLMQKVGLKYEATLRQSTLKEDRFVDMAVYGILRSDYEPVVKSSK